jgi:hypothetical protein
MEKFSVTIWSDAQSAEICTTGNGPKDQKWPLDYALGIASEMLGGGTMQTTNRITENNREYFIVRHCNLDGCPGNTLPYAIVELVK